jgi:hypothetical protein
MQKEDDASALSVIADATRIYVTSFPRFALVALLSHLPVMIVDTFSVLSPSARTDDLGLGAGARISMFLGTVALAITSAYVVPPVMSALGHRSAPSFGQVGARVGAALGTAWLTNLIVGIGILCFIVPGLVASIWFCVAIPAAVAEGVRARDAMSRSTSLTEGHRGTALALNMLYGLALIVTIVVTVAPGVWIDLAAEENGETVSDAVLVLTTVIPTAVQSLVVAFGSALFTVFYVRLRQVKDGIDADALAEVFA